MNHAMNPAKVSRGNLRTLTDLPNVGPAMAQDLRLLGIHTPEDLQGKDAFVLYDTLCRVTGTRHDPCVLDVLMSVVDFIEGGKPRAWWEFTPRRKAAIAARLR